jgi:hypothetical protein
VNANCGQTVVDGVLRWYLSYQCSNCGTAVEIDGEQDVPSDVRTSEIAEDGEWGLYRSRTCANIMLIAKSLRTYLGLQIAEAVSLAKHESAPLFMGTQPEVEWLRQALIRSGLESADLEARQLIAKN